jgi:hypothetical protein
MVQRSHNETKLLQNKNYMKKAMAKMAQVKDNDMRAEYDFTGGVRGKHYRAMQAGHTITIHNPDGTTVVKDVTPKKGAVALEPDVSAYFPDSEAVNKALRCLIPLLPKKHRTKALPGKKVKKRVA